MRFASLSFLLVACTHSHQPMDPPVEPMEPEPGPTAPVTTECASALEGAPCAFVEPCIEYWDFWGGLCGEVERRCTGGVVEVIDGRYACELDGYPACTTYPRELRGASARVFGDDLAALSGSTVRFVSAVVDAEGSTLALELADGSRREFRTASTFADAFDAVAPGTELVVDANVTGSDEFSEQVTRTLIVRLASDGTLLLHGLSWSDPLAQPPDAIEVGEVTLRFLPVCETEEYAGDCTFPIAHYEVSASLGRETVSAYPASHGDLVASEGTFRLDNLLAAGWQPTARTCAPLIPSRIELSFVRVGP